MHLFQSTTSKDLVGSKLAFKAYACDYEVKIKHYHTDNGRFSDNAFREAVEKGGQTIPFSGVNAHFQNGITEERIQELQDCYRTSLLFVQSLWPKFINTNLWQDSMRTYNLVLVLLSTLILIDGISPLEKFSGIPVSPKIRNFHAFDCPVYVLNNALQGGKSIPKLKILSRVVVYLGPSPQHSRYVALVLNLETGLVSSDFHTKFDDFFKTVFPNTVNPRIHSLWQSLADFLKLGSLRKKLEAAFIGADWARSIGTPVVFLSA